MFDSDAEVTLLMASRATSFIVSLVTFEGAKVRLRVPESSTVINDGDSDTDSYVVSGESIVTLISNGNKWYVRGATEKRIAPTKKTTRRSVAETAA